VRNRAGALTGAASSIEAYSTGRGNSVDARIQNLKFRLLSLRAKYKRVRTRTPSHAILPTCEFGEERNQEICCLVCMTPLPTKDGKSLLKYILVEHPKNKADQVADKKHPRVPPRAIGIDRS